MKWVLVAFIVFAVIAVWAGVAWAQEPPPDGGVRPDALMPVPEPTPIVGTIPPMPPPEHNPAPPAPKLTPVWTGDGLVVTTAQVYVPLVSK